MNPFKWLFHKTQAVIIPKPDPFAETDQTGRAITMDWLIAAMPENKEVPDVGDVIIKIVTDGMGASVQNDIRYRVNGPGILNGVSVAVPCTNVRTGFDAQLSVFYMRRHSRLARTWWLMD